MSSSLSWLLFLSCIATMLGNHGVRAGPKPITKSDVKRIESRSRNKARVLESKYKSAMSSYRSKRNQLLLDTNGRLRTLYATIRSDEIEARTYCRQHSTASCEEKKRIQHEQHTKETSDIAAHVDKEAAVLLEWLRDELMDLETEAVAAKTAIQSDQSDVQKLKKQYGDALADGFFDKEVSTIQKRLSWCTTLLRGMESDLVKIQSLLVQNLCFELNGLKRELKDGSPRKEQFEYAVADVAQDMLTEVDAYIQVVDAETVNQVVYTKVDRRRRARVLRKSAKIEADQALGVNVMLTFRCNCHEDNAVSDAFRRRRVLQEEEEEDPLEVENHDFSLWLQELHQEPLLNEDGRVLAPRSKPSSSTSPSTAEVVTQMETLLQEYVDIIFGEHVIVSVLPCRFLESLLNDQNNF